MDLAKIEDIDLMAMVREDDKDAFRELIGRHQKPLLNFFSKMGADTTTAEDMTQETFLRLFNYRMKYRPSAKFTTFLYTLARHVRADHLRKVYRSPQTEGDLAVAEENLSEERPVAPGDRLDLNEALGRLSDKLRAVVVMSVYQGLKYREVGEVLDIPVGTVKSRMHLAVQELKGMLNGN